ncbi:MAG: hypothetical protein HOV83_34750, partial [Catenulispora sp.]|nr:hypothetical protein [Catenulispora sp.]
MTEHGSRGPGPSRRQALSGAAAVGAASALLGGTAAADDGDARAAIVGAPRIGQSPVGVGRQKPSRALRELLAQVDPARLEATVLKLVSFGTRHTLTSQTDPARGS